jgi:hypothetical protein
MKARDRAPPHHRDDGRDEADTQPFAAMIFIMLVRLVIIVVTVIMDTGGAGGIDRS